ncbi:hypothetical protein ACFQ07_14175 [Actinomadura adrarensis]|uniref:Uncharacterized protein n=1 Tax=Actinomadura adrarensis TaxID=1819600 RepID=A0ABW3CIK9_9ACTN
MADEPSPVYLNLVIETDQAPEDLQLSVLAALSDHHKIVSTGVCGIAGDDDSTPTVSPPNSPSRRGPSSSSGLRTPTTEAR